MEQARRYYHSPEYQAAKAKRDGACVANSSLSKEPSDEGLLDRPRRRRKPDAYQNM